MIAVIFPTIFHEIEDVPGMPSRPHPWEHRPGAIDSAPPRIAARRSSTTVGRATVPQDVAEGAGGLTVADTRRFSHGARCRMQPGLRRPCRVELVSFRLFVLGNLNRR